MPIVGALPIKPSCRSGYGAAFGDCQSSCFESVAAI